MSTIDATTPQLRGLEGWRVEVVDRYGQTRRFIVGRNLRSAPMQIHLEIPRVDSSGGPQADSEYQSVRRLYDTGLRPRP